MSSAKKKRENELTRGSTQYNISSTRNHPKIPVLWQMSTFLVNTRNQLSHNLNSIPHLVRINNPPSWTGVSFVWSIPLSLWSLSALIYICNITTRTSLRKGDHKKRKKTRRLNFSKEISSGVGLFGVFSVRFSRLPSVRAHLGWRCTS